MSPPTSHDCCTKSDPIDTTKPKSRYRALASPNSVDFYMRDDHSGKIIEGPKPRSTARDGCILRRTRCHFLTPQRLYYNRKKKKKKKGKKKGCEKVRSYHSSGDAVKWPVQFRPIGCPRSLMSTSRSWHRYFNYCTSPCDPGQGLHSTG